MRVRTLASFAVVLAFALTLFAAPQGAWLSAPQRVASGVEFFTSTDPTLAEPAGPSAVYMLKLDPAKVRLSSAHAQGQVMGLETVDGIAARFKAVAGVNAGFFNTRNGDPSSVLKIAGEFVSDATVAKGVVLITAPPRGKTTLDFDQLGAKQELRVEPAAGGRTVTIPIDGVDTTRARAKLMLYTPMYNADTDTALSGTEWIASGKPLTIREVRPNMGHTPIPRDGVVLSYGGLELPAALGALKPGDRVTVVTNWKSTRGLPAAAFDAADHIVNGAGLLRRGGEIIKDWKAETLSPLTFIDVRHPRTIIGVDRDGFIWLISIDGRQPDYAVGMTFAEMQRLCDRLKLRDALNLDGGGSVTMVVKGKIVNRPSDAAGPRAVSDAILVTLR
jgi:hypothetical protein